MRAREQGHEFVLGRVGVLVFIDEYFLETLLVFPENVGMPPEHLQGARQQVIEIDRARLAQGALIGGLDLQGGSVDAERERVRNPPPPQARSCVAPSAPGPTGAGSAPR